MSSSKSLNSNMVRILSITGLMVAVTAIMSFVPFLGTIPLGIASISIAFLPAIVTVMLAGFYPGLAVATAAGVFSLIRNLTMPATLLSPYFQNPLVSVVPRIMIAVAVFLAFRVLVKIAPKPAAIGISAAVGSITNTVGVLGMLWLLYAAPLFEDITARGLGYGSVFAFLLSIVVTNALLEIVGNTIIATLVVLTLQKVKFSNAG